MSVEKFARWLTDKGEGDEALRLRVGQVDTVNASTVDITLGGGSTVIGSVPYLASYSPQAADVVVVIQDGPDLLVLGTTA